MPLRNSAFALLPLLGVLADYCFELAADLVISGIRQVGERAEHGPDRAIETAAVEMYRAVLLGKPH